MEHPAHILYVDDEQALRMAVEDDLTAEGFRVSTAGDGEEALRMMAKGPFDLVLLDIRMPRMDGLQLLQEMKSRGITPRVIMLTGDDDLDVAIKAVKLGANDYVTKPFDMEEIMTSIRRVLQV